MDSPSLNATIQAHIDTISEWDSDAGARASAQVTRAMILTRRRTLRHMRSLSIGDIQTNPGGGGNTAAEASSEDCVAGAKEPPVEPESRSEEDEDEVEDDDGGSGSPQESKPEAEREPRPQRRWQNSVEAEVVALETLDSENGPEGSTIEAFEFEGIHDL